MAITTYLKVWERRWQALNDSLAFLEQQLNDEINVAPAAERSDFQLLLHLVKGLREFADTQFHFLYDGLGEQRQYALQDSVEYPLEYVLSITLDQMSTDLEIIARATLQRLTRTPATSALTEQVAQPMPLFGAVKETLRKADKLASDALAPVKDILSFKKNPIALTYFQKSTAIRVIPYADVALIGIPFSCISVSRDFLAIPHEVGHYVFWHGQLLPDMEATRRKSIHTILRAKDVAPSSDPHRAWLEEIFADVYGCLIGGPAIALDFQDLQLENSSQRFVSDDGEHPTPAIRPYIYTHVLNRMARRDWARALNERWEHILHERYVDMAQTTYKKLVEERKHIEGIADLILDTLGMLSNVQSNWDINLDGLAPTDAKTLWGATTEEAGLYQRFEQFVKSTPPALAAESYAFAANIMPSVNLSDVWKQWVKEREFFDNAGEMSKGFAPRDDDAQRLPPTKDRQMIRRGTSADKKNGWVQLLVANGWATQGPNSGWNDD